jgi:tetratricopeptide (TPR) repeat protein
MSGARLLPVLVVAITLAVFAPIVTHEFVTWDDPDFVYANPSLFPVTPASLARVWIEPNALTNTAYVVLSALPAQGTIDPGVVHATSLVLHAAAALAAWLLLVQLASDPAAAAVGALLFALHPVQVEPVAWATGLKDVLSGLFGVLALGAWARAAHDGRTRRLPAGSGWLVLALLAKPTAVVVPVMAAVLDVTLLGRDWRTSLRRLVPWVLVSFAFGVLVVHGQAAALRDAPPLWARPLVALDALAFYARLLLAPRSLGPDYGRTPAAVLDAGWTHTALLGVAALATLAVLTRARRPWLTASVGLFVAGLLPVLGLTPFLFQRYSTVADRYCYLALLGPALALATLIARHRRPATLALAVVVLAVLGVRSALQLRVWRDSISLLEHGVRVNPASWALYENLGGVLAQQRHLERALVAYSESIRIRPTYASAHYNLGNVLFQQGRADDAIAAWTEALRLDPGFVLAHYNLGSALAERGEVDAGQAHFETAARLAPEFAPAREALREIAAWRQRQGAGSAPPSTDAGVPAPPPTGAGSP